MKFKSYFNSIPESRIDNTIFRFLEFLIKNLDYDLDQISCLNLKTGIDYILPRNVAIFKLRG